MISGSGKNGSTTCTPQNGAPRYVPKIPIRRHRSRERKCHCGLKVWIIPSFEFGTCFEFRASNFVLPSSSLDSPVMPAPSAVRLVLASRNRKKTGEMLALLAPHGIEVVSVAEFEGVPDVI